jgi:hypothetical protein
MRRLPVQKMHRPPPMSLGLPSHAFASKLASRAPWCMSYEINQFRRIHPNRPARPKAYVFFKCAPLRCVVASGGGVERALLQPMLFKDVAPDCEIGSQRKPGSRPKSGGRRGETAAPVCFAGNRDLNGGMGGRSQAYPSNSDASTTFHPRNAPQKSNHQRRRR